MQRMSDEDIARLERELPVTNFAARDILAALKAERQENEGNARLLNAEMGHSEKMRQRVVELERIVESQKEPPSVLRWRKLIQDRIEAQQRAEAAEAQNAALREAAREAAEYLESRHHWKLEEIAAKLRAALEKDDD